MIESSGIRTVFTAEAEEQARIAANTRITSYVRSRLDLRGKTVFTFGSSIEEAKNDCAFSLDKKRDTYNLGLHIADASEFVTESSPLDVEARMRGAGASLPGAAFPMLHEEVSSHACFFREGQDRLAVSVFLEIDKDGRMLSLRFEESVVRTARNCIFGEIDTLYSSTDSSSVLPLKEKYAVLLPNMNDMYELGALLLSERIKKGSVEFNQLKRKYTFNKEGLPQEVALVPDYDAKLLIREFLIFTGTQLAHYLQKNSIPCIYAYQTPICREQLLFIAKASSVTLENTNELTDLQLQKHLLASTALTEKAHIVNVLISKSLPPSLYTTEPKAHSLFGCPLVRFSGPTTRYADLVVQRILKEIIGAKGIASALNVPRMRKRAAEAARITSNAERSIYELQSKISDYYSSEIMRSNPDRGYSAFITEAGCSIRVSLENGIEGDVIPSEDDSKATDRGKENNENRYIGQRVEVVPLSLPDNGNNTFRIKEYRKCST